MKISPPRMIVLSFSGAILLGTILLCLPISTFQPARIRLVDSLFTVTSAVCVTGLTVKDTGTFFTPFGKCVILALIQMGGLGIMTFSTLFAVMLGRKLSFSAEETIRVSLDKYNPNIMGLKKLIFYIMGITLMIEAAGASLLFVKWHFMAGWSRGDAFSNAVFHSISAFCNAGFSLFKTNLMQFESDPLVNIVIMLLIFLGGIGFVVILDLFGVLFRKGEERRLSLQAKIVLITSFVLIAAGAVAFLFFEKDNVFKGMTLAERFWGATFQSVTARTAGFNTVPIGELSLPSLIVLKFLMFIGASPGSTGGGIKTCTFVVIMLTAMSMLGGKRRTFLFGRSIPKQAVREAIIVFFLSSACLFVSTVLVAFFQGKAGGAEMNLQQLLFEVTSAFGTVGLSTGITEQLSTASKLCIIATMFFGRIGPLTLALAIAFRRPTDKFLLPEENVMIG